MCLYIFVCFCIHNKQWRSHGFSKRRRLSMRLNNILSIHFPSNLTDLGLSLNSMSNIVFFLCDKESKYFNEKKKYKIN